MAGLKSEAGAAVGTVHDGDIEKTTTSVEYPDDADGDGDQQHDDATVDVVGLGLRGLNNPNAAAGSSSRSHKLMMLKFHMACEIIDFKHDVKELIQDYFNNDPYIPFMDNDERVPLLYAALDDDQVEVEVEQQVNLDEQGRLTVSAAGFVDVLHMRRCIKAFFDPYMADVQDGDADEDYDRNFWVNFMAATGFVNRLWDLRRIVDVCLDAELDLKTRKATIMARLADLEQLLQSRANAVATGEFSLSVI